ncbi:MAG: HisA/HisF-related TIM barrel protein, partial [Candidatus Omnitrophica bacterium]|nr:HisA/HisF-related TIM barrel protein [Candidatus Omnitrophota bacterium]
FMPLCYGGGIKTLDHAKRIFASGVEKIALNSVVLKNPEFVKQLSQIFGAQSIVVSVDVKKDFSGKYKVYDASQKKLTALDPLEFIKNLQELGAGEILLNSVDNDGTMQGYDIELIKTISHQVDIPIIACGGAGQVSDFTKAVKEGGADAVAAGSMFVFNGKYRAVLLSYPSMEELESIFK